MIDINLFSDVANPYFQGFMPEPLFDTSNQWMRIAYLDPQGTELLQRCHQHVEQFRSGADKRGAVVVVHPFYTLLEHPVYLADAGYQLVIDSAVESLTKIITDIDRDKFELVFVDVPEHYARFNSWFLESGLVDDVVFTESNVGYVITNNNSRRWIQRMVEKDIVCLGGEYEDECAGHTLETLMEFLQREKVHTVPEILVPTLKLYHRRQYVVAQHNADQSVKVADLCTNGRHC